MTRLRTIALGMLASACLATPARADITGFVGVNTTPVNRATTGIAVGTGLLVIGFEFEYAFTSDDQTVGAPSLKTGMGNVLLQTPVPILGFQPYFTAGGGVYREALGARTDTGFGVNTGGGVKVSLVGPLRLRVDYRLFKLGSGALGWAAVASAPRLRGTEPEILSYLPRSDTSVRLTKFWPDAYAPAYCL